MSGENLAVAFLDLITRELETDYVMDDMHLSDLTIFKVDLSPLRLRLSTEVPCIQVTESDIARFGRESVLDMAQQEIFLRQERPGSSLVLVETNSSFLQPLAQNPHWAVIIDAQQMRQLLEHVNPKRAFKKNIRERIPLRFLSPYEPNHPVTGSQFYGRTTELNLVLGRPDGSFTIEGGRRMGKTSLLREIRLQMRKRMPSSKYDLLVWCDFWGYTGIDPFLAEVMRHFDVVPKLAYGSLADYFPHFIKLMKKKYGGKVTFFLDEIDDLIEYERQHGYHLLSMLRKIATDDNCRCLFAGFRLLTNECYRHSTPLNFCDRVHLANLKEVPARAMLMEPMQSMGIKLPWEVFRRIQNETGGHPQLLQLFGHSLVALVDRDKTRAITLRHVNEIVNTGSVYDKLVETLMDNTSDLEFALACSLAGREDFGRTDINELLKAHGIDLAIKEINGILSFSGGHWRDSPRRTELRCLPLCCSLAACLGSPQAEHCRHGLGKGRSKAPASANSMNEHLSNPFHPSGPVEPSQDPLYMAPSVVDAVVDDLIARQCCLIIGPPGSGTTTTLLGVRDAYLARVQRAYWWPIDLARLPTTDSVAFFEALAAEGVHHFSKLAECWMQVRDDAASAAPSSVARDSQNLP